MNTPKIKEEKAMTDIHYLIKIVEKISPNEHEKRQIISILMGDKACHSKQKTGQQKTGQQKTDEIIKNFKKHINKVIEISKQLALPEGYGFDPYNTSDIMTYLCDPNQFHLSLKKEKGRGLLYGRDHAKLRRSLINNLPEGSRLHLLLPKLKKIKFLEKLKRVNEVSRSYPITYDNIVNIKDIGMAHSVYCVEIGSKEDECIGNERIENEGIEERDQNNIQNIQKTQKTQKVVIKEEQSIYQSVYCKVMGMLAYPTFFSYHSEDETGTWEISEYLGETNLTNYFEQQVSYDGALAKELARHAALGDILGRGDRHFENYVECKGHIYPIDISIMFWPNNEEWLEKYASANNSECNVVNCFQEIESLSVSETLKRFNEFMAEYEKGCELCKKKEEAILELLKHELRSEPHIEVKQAYVREKLKDIKKLVKETRSRNLRSIIEAKKRYVYKNLLQKVIIKDKALLDKHPCLKMYYLADKERQSTFYLYENKREEIHRQIEILSQKVLNQPKKIGQEKIDKINRSYRNSG